MRQADWRSFLKAPLTVAPGQNRLLRLLPSWTRSWEDWLTLSIVALLYLSAAGAMELAGWVPQMPSLVTVSVLAILVGVTLARRADGRRAGLRLQALALVLGVAVVLWQVLALLPGALPWDRADAFVDRFGLWVSIVRHGGISRDPLPFILLITGLTWLSAYFATWSVFRWHSPWLALIPASAALFSSVAYQPHEFHFSLVVFLFAALLLLMRLHLLDRLQEWDRGAVPRPEFISLSFVNYTSWAALLILSVSLSLPVAVRSGLVADLWEKALAPFDPIVDQFRGSFVGLRIRKVQPVHSFSDLQPFRGSIRLHDTPVAEVELGQVMVTSFLHGATYDVYSADGWQRGKGTVVSASEIRADDLLPQVGGAKIGVQREVVQAEVSVKVFRPVLLVPGQPLSVDVPASALLPEESVYEISPQRSAGSRASQDLPVDVRQIQGALAATGGLASDDEVRGLLGPDLRLLAVERDASKRRIEKVRIVRAAPLPDLLAVLNTANLQAGDSYRSQGIVIRATQDRLQGAGNAYPDWLSKRYLQLPNDLPSRVKRLAQEITADAVTPYEKARAIQTYLRQTYLFSLEMPDRPVGRDAVDFFLFDAKEGYFDYHASAMVVLLRAVGVPARLAVGYVLLPEAYDQQSGRYLVRERQAYAWPEVYFPSVGWYDFNATPGLPLIDLLPEEQPISDILGAEQIEPGELDLMVNPATPELEETDSAAKGGLRVDYRIVLGLAMAAAILGGSGLVLRFAWERSLAGLPYPAQVWEKTLRLARWAKLRPAPQQTPREYARFLSHELPEIEGIAMLGESYGRSQFGKKAPSEAEVESVRRVWLALRNKLIARVLRWR